EREADVRPAELRIEGAVDELDQRVDDALRMDAHGDPVERDAVEVMCLDHLEALVHQRGRVDGHLGAHRPAGMVQGLLYGHLVEVQVGMRPERAAAGGDDQASYVSELDRKSTRLNSSHEWISY